MIPIVGFDGAGVLSSVFATSAGILEENRQNIVNMAKLSYFRIKITTIKSQLVNF